ncbi:uncharacterized protein BCR38DRAFT_503349 [Pseudomassariella vexata]|uniref:Aminoglycoside phosphotransferase domain-containing protein n=1 Tax=Pseudomassariella vexata TaxID=1141098 RepID=A0A1Y2EFT7_9PEZI|nr:uncharacterized protein BCR38DRAFT_503349 [Pseudomassariella vexata]ORY70174.1 hypothetical protein BCR38DRAFT_503349 [Pseudomassariella vexata]
MMPQPSIGDISTALLAIYDLQLVSYTILQSLWAGYGYICHLTASHKETFEAHSLILKLITPPPLKADDEGHSRKLPRTVPVAQCLATVNEHHPDGTSITAMIISDLRHDFPIASGKRNSLTEIQVHAALAWLGQFHGFFWTRVGDLDRSRLVRPPLVEARGSDENRPDRAVWLNGGYTYLATRRNEYDSLAADAASEWSEALCRPIQGGLSTAEMVARILAPSEIAGGPLSRYETLIHGDVKSENLFTNIEEDQVAFYDFQYTGLGLGVCDLAKLFTCSVPLSMLTNERARELDISPAEMALLQEYHARLQSVDQRSYDWDVFVHHWESALVDWLRFQASWGFWGNTEWLEARVRSILKDQGWRSWLAKSIITDNNIQ